MSTTTDELRATVRVTLPIPPAELSPNARCHWAKKASAVKRMRTLSWGEARIALSPGVHPMWTRAELRVTWYFPDRRRRDPDNLLASLKSAIDGLRDAGVLADDDGLVILPAERKVDRDRPRVELEITPTDRRTAAPWRAALT